MRCPRASSHRQSAAARCRADIRAEDSLADACRGDRAMGPSTVIITVSRAYRYTQRQLQF